MASALGRFARIVLQRSHKTSLIAAPSSRSFAAEATSSGSSSSLKKAIYITLFGVGPLIFVAQSSLSLTNSLTGLPRNAPKSKGD